MHEYINSFERSLDGFIDIYLLIEDTTTKVPIGFIYNYDTSRIDNYTFLATYLCQDRRNQGVGKVSIAMFIDYLFCYFPFRKIYCEAFEFNDVSVGFARSYKLEQEGFFAKHRWYGGQYWGLYRYALYREEWPRIHPKILGRS